MAHGLILGMTESGKTTLAKKMAAQFKANNIGVLVFDPLHDPNWPCDFKTDNQDAFLKVFWQSKSCVAFIDEAGESVGQHDKLMHATATRGRHWGHRCFYIAQRITQIAPIVRDQCSYLFLFNSSLSDAKIHANEWNHRELEQAHTLLQGEYFQCTRYTPVQKLKVFDTRQKF